MALDGSQDDQIKLQGVFNIIYYIFLLSFFQHSQYPQLFPISWGVVSYLPVITVAHVGLKSIKVFSELALLSVNADRAPDEMCIILLGNNIQEQISKSKRERERERERERDNTCECRSGTR